MAAPLDSAAATSAISRPASAAPTASLPASPSVRPVVPPSDSSDAPPRPMVSPASSDPHTSDEEFVDAFFGWGSDFNARRAARAPPPPAAVTDVAPAAVVEPATVAADPVLAAIAHEPVRPPSSPVRAPSSPVPPPASLVRAPASLTPTGVAEDAPAPTSTAPSTRTPDAGQGEVTSAASPAASSSVTPNTPSKSLEELIYEITVEDSSGDEDEAASGDDGAETSAQAAPVPGEGLFDDDEEKEEEPRPKRARLRRGDETSNWHPPLPSPPDRHPSTRHRNHYNPNSEWDYDNVAPIVRLLDVQGEAPHRCYLVQWKGKPLQMSWVWMELLDYDSTRPMMEQVDQWKADGGTETFMEWNNVRDTASEAGTCFMDAFRSALYYLGQPNLVTMEMWDAFEDTRPASIAYGVSRNDVTDFFKELQRNSVPLNYEVMLPNILRESSANVATLQRIFTNLAPGAYMVSASQDDIGHCFVVVKTGLSDRLVVLDGYSAEKDPPMEVCPLSYYQWIENVKWVTCVELKPGYVCRHGKRKSKTQRKQTKRKKQQ